MLQGGYVSQSSGSKQLTVTKKSNVLDKGNRTKAAASNNGNGSENNGGGGGGGGGGTGVSVSTRFYREVSRVIANPRLRVSSVAPRPKGCP